MDIFLAYLQAQIDMKEKKLIDANNSLKILCESSTGYDSKQSKVKDIVETEIEMKTLKEILSIYIGCQTNETKMD